ncbi:MAG TPA: hypothetical protein VEJ36_01890 [Nitrososphaerales archaeon]|nr:hypothetical protein [Nitrososphaerales archaeon]
MQTTVVPGATRSSASESRPAVSQGELKVLLALSSGETETETLRTKLRLTEPEFHSILGSLQRQYFVDAVSQLLGDQVRERLCLTELGESVLTGTMERMCELPE